MISLLLLIGFIKISLYHNNPLILAGAYTAMTTLFAAMFGVELAVLLVSAITNFGLVFLFFWLLDRYEETGVWWGIALGFPVLLLVLNSVL